MGGFYGFYPDSPHPYPNPEQMRCVRDFWRERFLLSMVRANELTDGHCLKTPDKTKYVFYKENADTIRLDLSAAAAALKAVAVDTTKEYREIDLGGIGKGFALDELRKLLLDWGAAEKRDETTPSCPSTRSAHSG